MMKRIKYAIAALLPTLAVGLCGCINDYDNCPDDIAGGAMALKIRMLVPNVEPQTRNAGDGSDAGTDAENIIDVANGDFHLLIFGGDGMLLMQSDAMEVENTETSPEYKIYTLTAPVDPSNDVDNLSHFRVMILANWKSFDADASYGRFYGTGIEGTNRNIYSNGTDFNFAMPNSGGKVSWVPAAEEPATLVPMFGVSDWLDMGAAVEDAETGKTTVSTSIYMLRSIAKVEIVDALGESEGPVSSVVLSRSNKYGRFIPDVDANPGWNNASQVTSPSLPAIYLPKGPASESDAAYVGNVMLVKAPYTRQYEGRDCTTYVAYIPEMRLASEDTGLPRPVFSVTTGDGTFDARFTNYRNGAVDTVSPLMAVLRNHIYRYFITGIGKTVEMTLNVLAWNMQYDDDAWYFDTPEVSQTLQWTTVYGEDDPDHEAGDPNGYEDDPDRLRLLMKPGVTDFAEGTFTLSAPMNAKWSAQLVPTLGKSDAFFFTTGAKDENGRLIEGDDWGIIKGGPITIRIANREETVEESNNEARLVIMVEFPDLSRKEVIVTDTDKGFNYTIVQALTEIM